MNDERRAMLERVRASLRTGYLPGDALTRDGRAAAPEPDAHLAEMIERFERELKAVGGELLRPGDDDEARRMVVGLIHEAGGGPILAWPDEELPLPGLGDALRVANIERLFTSLSPLPDERRAQLAALDAVQVGLTGASAGLAYTGSIVIRSGSTRPGIASLLPLLHIALLRREDLLPDMAAFFARHAAADLTGPARNLLFITGPSRTADIEMVLTRGVHGPKRLVVVLLV